METYIERSDYMSKKVESAFEEMTLKSLEKIDSLELGSEERSRATSDLVNLYRANAEQRKTTEERWFKIATIATQIGLAVGGWILYDKWSARGMKFEETGHVSSKWTQQLNSKIGSKI